MSVHKFLIQQFVIGWSCHNPTFGRHSNSQNGDLRVLRDSQNFRVQLQGSKHLALRHSS
jgi:hypothetical protein